MAAVRGYRKLADYWQKSLGQNASLAHYLGGAPRTAAMETWSRLSVTFNYNTAQDRKLIRALPGPPSGGIDALHIKLNARRTRQLEAAVDMFNREADRYMVARSLNLSRGEVSYEHADEVFSELNLRGNRGIGFTISLPAWSLLVRKFGYATIPGAMPGPGHQLVINARVVGMNTDGIVTRFWALCVTGAKNPAIVTIDRTTSVSPEDGVRHTWSNALTTTELTAKNLQKVYRND